MPKRLSIDSCSKNQKNTALACAGAVFFEGCFSGGTEKDDADAQYMLGFCLMHGSGMEKNKEEGLKLYEKAAAQNQVDAIGAVQVYSRRFHCS
ncbi:MAG: SEL1-like repeat protein [Bacteroidales bacterium]|nr:SEL1-like repeat protein [Bacteroidales bacterium]